MLRGETSLGLRLGDLWGGGAPTILTSPVSPSRHSKAGQCWRCAHLCWSSCQFWMLPSQTWGPPRGGEVCCWDLFASWARTFSI